MVSSHNIVSQVARVSATFLLITFSSFTIVQSASQLSGDAALGEKVFKKCKACHKIGEGAKNSTGPVLNNVIGRAAASYEGYGYGKSMRAAGAKGLVWDAEQISKYITNPKKYLRAYLGKKKAKAKMKFKLKKEEDRNNVIAYLATFSTAATMEETDEKKAMMSDGSREANAALPSHAAKENEICVQNNFPKDLLLVVDPKGGQRKLKTLGQSGVLCVDAGTERKGTVGIFENEDALEGCSRLAKAGKTEVLIEYASFDNCAWKN